MTTNNGESNGIKKGNDMETGEIVVLTLNHYRFANITCKASPIAGLGLRARHPGLAENPNPMGLGLRVLGFS